ncbi:linker nucleoporin NIC96 NDAI_0B02110 [Naumovozyma dairenensis CBS 421]|uniref:Nuclear pore protein n=1 Tax=Naumovozyma dairenensis (strain ATCC 10597 / BCRC 20456 / CBS 421 / NBRC 0211 / NRRL Y-12639) TaxID=1071378 RepID=G0W635_NAUDC|nr:hypothetical protein NDAI_0B02110 [Naumovozyma dairenensis CBS 421]CCD23246.1 hypothetical protein NDAI_0B02110 [Naumovozyma dairenensis CBS 421]
MSNSIANGNTTLESSTKGSAKIFNDLVESSKNLPATSSQLGSIQLSVNEIKRRAIELRKKKNIDNTLTKAHYLLAGSGLAIEDVDSSLKNLQKNELSERKLTSKYVGNEIDTYLRVKKGENILASIEQLLADASRDFDDYVNQSLELDWTKRKDEIRETFGIFVPGKSENNSFVNKPLSPLDRVSPTWGNSGIGILNGGDSRLNVNSNLITREKFETYAKIIHQFNNHRQENRQFPLNREVISILSHAGDTRNRQLLESWKIIESIKDPKNTIKASREYLEVQFLDYVDALSKNAISEGLPTNTNKVRSFIDTKLKNTDGSWKIANLTVINGLPIWASIFYLLRAGLMQEALDLAMTNSSGFKKIEQSFLTYFQAYISSPENKLPTEFATKLHTEFNQHIKNSLNGDPYRLAVYKIIGRCDLTRRNISLVTLSLEDWIWYHLKLIKEDVIDDGPIYEKYHLEDFQNIILSYGPSRFTNYYIPVLILSGLYEVAIDYAYNLNEMDAVHLAIGLANKKLLHITTNISDTLIAIEDGRRKVNFAKLLGNYTKSFKFSDPRIATEYLILIAITDDPAEIKICHEALRELVLDTKEFGILLGKINRDGTRIPGVLEERQDLLYLNDEKEFLRVITEQAAHKADEDGRTQDSLLLYQLAEEYDIVMSIVNGLLGSLLGGSDLTQPLFTKDDNSETNPVLLASKLISIYNNNLEIAKKIHAKNKETCLLLLQIADIRKSYAENQWQYALGQIEKLDLLPFTDGQDARRKAQAFSGFDEPIVKCIPSLLIMTLTCVSKLVNVLNQSDYKSVTKSQQIEFLKNISKNCIVYAGIIQFKMPRETYSTLIRLDVELC